MIGLRCVYSNQELVFDFHHREYISPFMNVAVDEYDYFAKQIQKVFPETCYSDYM
jgi:hypothetical protein